MGKGDIKSAKGKRINGSYGNTRKRKKATSAVEAAAPKEKKVTEKPAAEKKAPAAEKKAPAAKKATATKTAAAKPAAKKTTTKKDDSDK